MIKIHWSFMRYNGLKFLYTYREEGQKRRKGRGEGIKAVMTNGSQDADGRFIFE